MMMMIDLTKTRLFASCDPVRVKRIERMVNDKEYMAKHIKRLMLRRHMHIRFAPHGDFDITVHDVGHDFDNDLYIGFYVRTKNLGSLVAAVARVGINKGLVDAAKYVKARFDRETMMLKWEKDIQKRENEDHHGGICLQHDVTYDGKKCLLSTVKLPYSEMYETMLFAYKDDKVNYRELFCKRYNSKDDAAWGHFEAMGRLAKDGSLPDPDGEIYCIGKADEVK